MILETLEQVAVRPIYHCRCVVRDSDEELESD
jgi:hypothetical protein